MMNIIDCCQKDSCKKWNNNYRGNCFLTDDDYVNCRQFHCYDEPLATIAQQPLSGSQGSPKCPSDTSDNGKRCRK